MDKPISESRRAFEKWCRENGYTNGSRLSQVWGEFDTENWELWKVACEYMETAKMDKLMIIENIEHNAQVLSEIIDGERKNDESIRDAILVNLCEAMVFLLGKAR